MGEIRDEFATAAATPDHLRPGDIDIEDLIDDEDLVVVMTAKGYIKTVSADAFKTRAAAAAVSPGRS
jgi:DNA gyrase subunit A